MRAFLTNIVSGGKANINQLRDVVPDDNHGGAYQPFMQTPLNRASIAEIAAARPDAQRAMARSVPGFLFLKTHSLFGVHLGTPTILPEVTAGAIYIVRNPLDVAVSYSEFKNRSYHATIELMNSKGRVLDRPEFGAYNVSGSWAENVQSWTRSRNDRLLVIRYEDMLERPIETFGQVVQHLRMDVSAADLQRAVDETAFDTLKQAEQEQGFVERPIETKVFFRSGKAGGWRHELNEAQIRQVVLTCHQQMRQFGYWEPVFERFLPAPVRAGAAGKAAGSDAVVP